MEKRNQTGAGLLEQKVAFDKREEVEDEYGNMVAGWIEQFQDRAAFIYLRASESVMAARLESREPMLVRIRMSANARLIENEWQMRDLRDADKPYNVRDVTWDNNRAVVDLLVEGGVATG
jgi:head-tail adaptor